MGVFEMSARIEVQMQCGSCDRVEWCQLVDVDCDEHGWIPHFEQVPEGWFLELGETVLQHIVQCPDHRRIS